ncbi:nitrilase-related carbon-nitrogen hydrolase [Serpentinicella sp. ANB-PHB4]|uniref:nitrilase-related carbon-nitrogen hydrolase n=1 Tax=Serpentinicella sp. ANB-PHB4 TaxID=3074076 RepID=UPI002856696F|nr:nitrilase-related carbon-nitrogen hydrolase [Serpentinicella sp. ANB-PHB4]MDR5659601.1 nitrilase-related carbon-nitrogen hydrolase [Serpentinicella sp. ANB-PHB4]
MSIIKIALVQMNICKGDYYKNKSTVSRLTKSLDDHVDVIVLPEMWSVDFDFRKMNIHSLDTAIVVQDLSELSQKYNAVVVGGSIPEKAGDRIFNTSFVFDKLGNIQDKYSKMHLVTANNLEAKIFEPGNWIPKFKVNNTTFGVANCYDIRFPELFRGLALQGSKIIFVTAQFADPLYNHWITLLKARAIENQVFIVGTNRVGKNYFGHSVVISPTGEVIYEADDTEGLHTVSIDVNEVDRVQNKRRDSDIMNTFAYNKFIYKSNCIGVGGIVDNKGKILLVKQSYGNFKNKWFLPSGYLDPGEMLHEGIEREVLEETSIKSKAKDVFAIRTLVDNEITDCFIAFTMDFVDGIPKSDCFENSDVAFFSYDQIIDNQEISPLAKDILETYFNKKLIALKENNKNTLNKLEKIYI